MFMNTSQNHEISPQNEKVHTKVFLNIRCKVGVINNGQYKTKPGGLAHKTQRKVMWYEKVKMYCKFTKIKSLN